MDQIRLTLFKAKLKEGKITQDEYNHLVQIDQGIKEDDKSTMLIDSKGTMHRADKLLKKQQTLASGEALSRVPEQARIWLMTQVKQKSITVDDAFGAAFLGPKAVSELMLDGLALVCVPSALDRGVSEAAEYHSAVVKLQCVIRAFIAKKTVSAMRKEAASVSQIKQKDVEKNTEDDNISVPTEIQKDNSVSIPPETTDTIQDSAVSSPSEFPQAQKYSNSENSEKRNKGQQIYLEATLIRKLDDDMRPTPYGFEATYRKASLLGRGTAITLVSIEPGSAAEEAGLLVGDQIVAISSVKTSSLTTEQCKQLLKEDRIRIKVKHDKKREQKIKKKGRKKSKDSNAVNSEDVNSEAFVGELHPDVIAFREMLSAMDEELEAQEEADINDALARVSKRSDTAKSGKWGSLRVKKNEGNVNNEGLYSTVDKEKKHLGRPAMPTPVTGNDSAEYESGEPLYETIPCNEVASKNNSVRPNVELYATLEDMANLTTAKVVTLKDDKKNQNENWKVLTAVESEE
eukprot:m.104052 g.104052  ORF g.104052 m.104052 type:complete len:516 (+) comp13831_c0_seq9:177-1724(+)